MSEAYYSTDPRLKIALLITVEWWDAEGRRKRVRTITDNISLGGICLILPVGSFDLSLALNREVQVEVNQGRIITMATIKHITQNEDGSHRVGVELIEPVFEWLSRYKLCNPELLRSVIPTTLAQLERRKK